MSVQTFNKCSLPKSKRNRDTTDFSKVGGLSHHINTLRDLIIFPLLHGHVYSHFHIKAPRGVLFYGPPGTGKTLVAGALATEISKDSACKVSFYQRKGADILDKWVGESEKKLRELFDKAAKNRPAVIFFDELDGLAPKRSSKNDHVHCSVVATLLALMDGLDSMPGVVVIGATNRLDSVDPALRRPGRFDKELYFPLPATDARKEILQVHTQSWKHKPSSPFLSRLAEMTTGFCGSDLQALCAEAVLCCCKRIYPNIQKSLTSCKIKIDLDEIKVEECDFLTALQNSVSTALKTGSKRRKLSPTVRPLLDRQLTKIMNHISLAWPHFLEQGHKYLIGSERYSGRLVLFGTNSQGLNTHLLPAILQALEHLPAYILDIPTIFDKSISSVTTNLPSVLVLSRLDEWWDLVENSAQISIAAALEDIHAGLPILIVATCKDEIPCLLHDFFYSNYSIIINVEDPTEEEKSQFFAPAFFDDKQLSVTSALMAIRGTCVPILEKDIKKEPGSPRVGAPGGGIGRGGRGRRKSRNKRLRAGQDRASSYVLRLRAGGMIRKSYRQDPPYLRHLNSKKSQHNVSTCSSHDALSYCSTCANLQKKKHFSSIITDIVGQRAQMVSVSNLVCDKPIKKEPRSEMSLRNRSSEQRDSSVSDTEKAKIFNLWKRTVQKTAKNMSVAELELVYDAILSCISMYSYNFKAMYEHLENVLVRFESS